ncbi:MAG: type IX secretion system membrane protein PorP/SprF [Chryseolinea sp.]
MRTTPFLLTLLAILLFAVSSFGQQVSLFSQYMFNGMVINPAYTGSHESMTVTAASRTQWTGLNKAPRTETASFHSPIKFTRSAAGAVLMHDNVGVTNQYMAYGTYAYHIPVSKNGKLSVGAQAGLTYYQANLMDANVVTANNLQDPTFARTESRFLPNLGIGAYYYSKRSYLGLSLPTLINNRWNSEDANIARQRRHYFLSVGHVFDLSPNVKFKPNVLLRWAEGGAFQYDLNANVLFHEILWVGVSYRMNDAIDGLLELVINNQFNLGYSYGYPTSALASTQAGTHEIVINYRIRKNKNIVFSPRYF